MSLILPRREFLIGAAAASSLIVAPTIIKEYDHLMDINRRGNRIVVGWRMYPHSPWRKSGLNMIDAITPRKYKAWVQFHHENEYQFVRLDEIHENCRGCLSDRLAQYELDEALKHYDVMEKARRKYFG